MTGPQITLVALSAASIHRLTELDRTTDPTPYVAEVEDFVYVSGAAEVLRSGAGHVLLIVDGDAPIGVAVHRPHAQFPKAQHLSAVVLAPGQRGKGLGEPAFRAVVDDAHARSGQPHVVWLVHTGNTAMQAISERVAGETGYADGDYIVYVHDR